MSEIHILSSLEFAQIIAKQKAVIVQNFIERARAEVPAARNEDDYYLRDHLPNVLDEMIDFLQAGGRGKLAAKAARMADNHGHQRARSTKYTVTDIRQEFSIVRELVFEQLQPHQVLKSEDTSHFAQICEVNLSHATEAFLRSSVIQESLEKKLAAENQRHWFEELLNRLPSPLFILDPKNKEVVFSNKAADKFIGFTYAGTHPSTTYGTRISAVSAEGDMLDLSETPSARAMNGEELRGEVFTMVNSTGRFEIRAYSEQLPASYDQPDLAVLLIEDITPLKAIEVSLKKTELELKQAIEIAKIGFWFIELPSYQLKVNPLFLLQFGFTESSFSGAIEAAFNRIHAEDRELVRNLLDQCIEQGLSFHREYRVVLPTGAICWIEAHGEPAFDGRGRRIGFTGTTLDISERVKSRIKIENSARELEELANSMPQVVWRADSNGNLDYFNQVWFDYSGTDYEKNVGSGWVQAVHPQDFPLTIEQWNAALQSGQIYENEFRLRAKNGDYRWHIARAIPVKDCQGKIIKWYGTNTDIHDQKMLSVQLQVTKDRLELAMSNAGIGVWHFDLETNQITTSQNAAALVGLTEVHLNIFELIEKSMHPEDREKVNRVLQEAIAQQKDYFDEYRIIRRDGAVRWLRSTGRGRYRKDGMTSPHIAGIVLDITDEKERLEQINQARKMAEAASAAKSQFLANMSHEIRTPLGAITGFVSLLNDDTLTVQERQGFLSVIDRNSSQLLRIVDDILDLSKVEAGMMMIEQIDFSLPELLSDFCSLMGLKAREKNILFTFKATSLLPETVKTDPIRLRQILMNVVGNAIKFTDRGFVHLNVSFKNQILNFDIEDSGRGISPDQELQLFQAFSQADTSTTRKYGGTGLGLVLSRRLTEALGGKFFLKKSSLGKGSTFVVSIPLEMNPEPQMVEGRSFAIEASTPVGKKGQLAGMIILLVEDSPDNQTLISILLTRAGAQVQIASNGAEGFEMALEGKFDVVLMDVQMPVMDGIAAVQKLRKNGFKKSVIALTAHAMSEEKARCAAAGFSDFLSKPIGREDLISAVLRGSLSAS